MRLMIKYLSLTLCIVCGTFTSATAVESSAPITADSLIRKAMDNWRGLSSYSEMTMTVHRPEWERSTTMIAWSEGDDQSLVRVTAPKRDAGNGTLLNGKNMWTYSPKVNRIIKIPSSMMNQSWMGSDFSNRDISKTTDILEHYDHVLSHTETKDAHTYYTITSTPHEDAPVVWGKEVITVRDDFAMTRHEFWDQNNQLVKVMEAQQVTIMDGKPVANKIRMGKVDEPDEWTQIETHTIDFDIDIQDNLFTLSNLRNPRD